MKVKVEKEGWKCSSVGEELLGTHEDLKRQGGRKESRGEKRRRDKGREGKA